MGIWNWLTGLFDHCDGKTGDCSPLYTDINSATGLPMVGGIGEIDMADNLLANVGANAVKFFGGLFGGFGCSRACSHDWYTTVISSRFDSGSGLQAGHLPPQLLLLHRYC